MTEKPDAPHFFVNPNRPDDIREFVEVVADPDVQRQLLDEAFTDKVDAIEAISTAIRKGLSAEVIIEMYGGDKALEVTLGPVIAAELINLKELQERSK